MVYVDFLLPTSMKCDYISLELVYIEINSLYIKHSLHTGINITFLVILINFINFNLNGHDLRYSHSRHSLCDHISLKKSSFVYCRPVETYTLVVYVNNQIMGNQTVLECLY